MSRSSVASCDAAASSVPCLTGMSGIFYLVAALVLDAVFLQKAWQLLKSDRADLPMRTFRFSINYLALLFAALLVDHYLPRAPF